MRLRRFCQMEQDDESRVWDTTTANGMYWVLILYMTKEVTCVCYETRAPFLLPGECPDPREA
jgi:hypothetical protein